TCSEITSTIEVRSRTSAMSSSRIRPAIAVRTPFPRPVYILPGRRANLRPGPARSSRRGGVMQAESRREYVEYVTARLPALRRLAYLICGDEHRADDLVQQTITKLYMHWRRIGDVAHLDQYVRTML